MSVLTVGPNSTFPTIAAAMLSAGPNDTISLEPGYSNETATVTRGGLTIDGGATSTGIVLHLASGIAAVTLTGSAPINLTDAGDGNAIVGNAGDNVITVTDGADTVNGGAGIDRLIVDYRLATGAVTGDSTSNISEAGGSHLVTITDGTFEHFTIFTGSGADTITTGAGDDVIKVGSGANTVTAGQGANVITGGVDADTITALDGGNIVDAGDGTNVITTGGGVDVITTGVGADTISAGGGDDLITVRGGSDTVHGEAGTDRLIVDYSASVTAVTMNAPTGSLAGYSGTVADLGVNTVSFDGLETFAVTGGSAGDRITTGTGNDTLIGGGGADYLTGAGGADTLTGGAGADMFLYSAATDSNAAAYDTITDFAMGVDRIDVSALGAGGAVSINRYGANSVVGFQGASGATGVLVAQGVVQGFDVVTGANTTFYISGSDAVESIFGSAGVDVINGAGGDDSIAGLTGADSLTGGAGADSFYYFSVADSSAAAYDTINDFQTGVDHIDVSYATGAGGAVSITRYGSASVVGFQAASGPTGVLITQGVVQGTDFVLGANTTVYVSGSAAGETIIGSAGVDVITGGGGADTLTGGAAADIFRYTSVSESTRSDYDTITDFQTGIDHIDLSALGGGSVSINQYGANAVVGFFGPDGGPTGVIVINGVIHQDDFITGGQTTFYGDT